MIASIVMAEVAKLLANGGIMVREALKRLHCQLSHLSQATFELIEPSFEFDTPCCFTNKVNGKVHG